MEIVDIQEMEDDCLVTVDMTPDERSVFTEYGLRLGFLCMYHNITLDKALEMIENGIMKNNEVEKIDD